MPLLTERRGTIARGPGQGLRFSGTGGYPGYLLGTSEAEEQAFIACHLHEGDVFYDIGANIGFFSTIAGRLVGSTGSVWAFEPLGATAAVTRENAALNGFEHVHVIEAAVADREGRQTLRLGAGTATNRLDADEGSGVRVDVVTVDAWRARTGAPPPDLVQIDVEGGELDVLRGMLETIRVSTPIVLCEIHWIGHQFNDLVERELAPLGYRVSALDGDPPSDIRRWHAVLTPPRRTG